MPSTAAELPKEVQTFIERRQACDHWRGEEGYDAERQADINWAICQSCVGADAEWERLKRKFKHRPEVLKPLNALGPVGEYKDAAEVKRFCAATRKPAWQP